MSSRRKVMLARRLQPDGARLGCAGATTGTCLGGGQCGLEATELLLLAPLVVGAAADLLDVTMTGAARALDDHGPPARQRAQRRGREQRDRPRLASARFQPASRPV